MRIAKPLLTGIALAAWSCCALAGVTEVVHSATAGASSVASKAEHAVKRGVDAGISGVERGTKAAGHAIETGAKKIGIPGNPPPHASTTPRGEMTPAR